MRKIIFGVTIIFSFVLLSYHYKIKKVSASSPIAWLEDGMTRIFKTDPVKITQEITLYSAKNEYEPFQIVVKAPDANSLTNVNISVTDLIGPNGNLISANYIQLFREHYLNVTSGSRNWTGQTNVPIGPGWYPDALIPFKDPETGQDLTGVLDAAPFGVSAGENQPVWADIYIPPQTETGVYNGTVEITSDQGSSVLNITLNIWNFSLPQTRSLKGQSQLKWNSIYNNSNSNVELIKHRFNPKTVTNSDERFLIDQYAFDRRHVFVESGASYGNCVSNPPPSVSDVMAEASLHQPELYLFDSYANEVWDCTSLFPTFLEWAANLRAGGVHPEIVTYPVDALMGTDLDHTAGDVWYILPKHYDLAVTNINRLVNHPGTYVMSYNPLVQEGYSPKFTIDFLPINARIMQGFINQSLGLTGTKFWRVDNWSADPWNDPNLLNQGDVPVPGEAAMVYPGDSVGLPNKIVSGVRMKLFREGSEDFEYIDILKKLGYGQFALDISRSVGSDFRNWTQNKDQLLLARKTLGDKIHELSSPPTDPTETPVPPTITPTLTFTPTPTDTPTPTITPTPTFTPTPTLTSSPTPVPVINLLLNSGFELDANGNNKPDNWTSSNKFTRTNQIYYTGSYSGKHQSSSNASYTISQTVTKLSANTNYSFSGYVNILPTTDSFTFTLLIQWFNSSGKVISTVPMGNFSGTTNGWIFSSANLTSPANTVKAAVQMKMSNFAATAFVDDFYFGR